MALLRLIAEGVGPFERLNLDFSDGNLRPRPGPHILAGVNGSGKSTVLRAIAWALEQDGAGFDHQAWGHLTQGHAFSRVLAIIRDQTGEPYALAREAGGGSIYYGVTQSLEDWAQAEVATYGLSEINPQTPQPGLRRGLLGIRLPQTSSVDMSRLRLERPGHKRGHPSEVWGETFNVAGYAPSTQLSWIDQPNLAASLPDPGHQSLAFHDAVQNAAIQAWLLSLYSKRAIAMTRERHESSEPYTRSLSRFEAALKLLYGEDVQFDVEIEPVFQPRLRMRNRELNFSQLPDGVRNTVGWIADFMMRRDAVSWAYELDDMRPGLLLLDEVDAHLHPRWQRLLLPAMRKALPDVQIIATSHSPFVISSCGEAVIHVLEVDSDGVATNRPPAPAPVGESITTTLKDIFDVESRFDIETERDLNEWNGLTRRAAAGRISRDERNRLSKLTGILSERSEELRSLVGSAVRPSEALLDTLLHR
jgi:predicted ATPase